MSEVQDLEFGQAGITTAQQLYTYSVNDPLGRDYTLTDLAGRSTQYTYACCGLDNVVDPDGVTTEYTYDVLKRPVATTTLRGTPNGVTLTNVIQRAWPRAGCPTDRFRQQR